MRHVWEIIEVHKTFWWGRPEVKRPFGRPRRRWRNNIKVNLQKKWVGEECTGLIWLRIGTDGALVNTVITLRVP